MNNALVPSLLQHHNTARLKNSEYFSIMFSMKAHKSSWISFLNLVGF